MVEVFSSLLRSRAALQLEKIALRHHIGVLQRSAKKRLQLQNSDRLFWFGAVPSMERVTLGARNPQARHRDCLASQRLSNVLDLEMRRGKPERPAVSPEVRALIRRMSRENPGWGAHAFTTKC